MADTEVEPGEIKEGDNVSKAILVYLKNLQ
jgi:hypothetical protein